MLRKRALERIVRGFSNHRRIEMLELIDKRPELTLTEISELLKGNIKTTSGHLTRLIVAGLIMKKSQKTSIRHKLSDRGKLVLNFLESLE